MPKWKLVAMMAFALLMIATGALMISRAPSLHLSNSGPAAIPALFLKRFLDQGSLTLDTLLIIERGLGALILVFGAYCALVFGRLLYQREKN